MQCFLIHTNVETKYQMFRVGIIEPMIFTQILHVGEYNVNIISLMYQNINVCLKLQYIQKFIYYVK
jgi:hypothetical protein